jgi:hypothetical protein
MSIDALGTWKSELANLPKVGDDSWKSNLADYISDRITSKLNLLTYSPPVSFTFNKSAFIAQLSGVTPALANGVEKIADGVVAGITGGLTVAPGTSFGGETPAETFSVVASSIFDAASLILVDVKIMELESATPVDDVNDSIFPEKIRSGVLLATATVTGTDSVTPPSGPNPLTDALRGVE